MNKGRNTVARSILDWDDSDDDDLEGDGSQGGQGTPDLRKAYNKLKREYKELASKYSETQVALRTRSVKDVLAAKGIDEAVAAFIPESMTSEDEVAAWIDQFGHLFSGAAKQDPSADDGNNMQQDPQNDPNLAALARIAGAQQGGSTFSGDESQMLGLIKAAESPEALNTLLFGNPYGPNAS